MCEFVWPQTPIYKIMIICQHIFYMNMDAKICCNKQTINKKAHDASLLTFLWFSNGCKNFARASKHCWYLNPGRTKDILVLSYIFNCFWVSTTCAAAPSAPLLPPPLHLCIFGKWQKGETLGLAMPKRQFLFLFLADFVFAACIVFLFILTFSSMKFTHAAERREGYFRSR